MSDGTVDARPGVTLSRGPSSLGEALGAVALVMADGVLNDLADAPASYWRPWLGAGVAAIAVHAIWDIARTRRIVAGPSGVHWTGGLSPSAGTVPWRSVWRVDALHARLGTRWRIDVLHGPAHDPRLITLRGPGRWADLRVRTPDRIAAWWRGAGDEPRVSSHDWGWRLEVERELPARARRPLLPFRAAARS